MTFYPRLLLLNGAPVQRLNATGITMINLLADWPQENLAEIYFGTIDEKLRWCSNSMRGDLRCWFDPRRVAKSAAGAALSSSPATGADLTKKSLLRATAQCVAPRLDREMIDFARKFRPDVILTLGGDLRYLRLAGKLARKMGVPAVLYCMDDWIGTLFRESALFPHRKYLNFQVGRFLKHSPFMFTISEKMGSEYSARYRIACHDFMNCSEPRDIPADSGRSGGSRTLLYLGGLHLNRHTNLLDIGRALDELNRRRACPARLKIRCPRADADAYRRELEQCRAIDLLPPIGHDEVAEAMRNADALVHVESFLPEDSLYTRLSVSTKLPEYFASGTSVFGYGPRGVASMEVIAASLAGAAAYSKEELPGVLERLLDDPQWRRELACNALDLARRKYCAEKMRREFAGLLFAASREAVR